MHQSRPRTTCGGCSASGSSRWRTRRTWSCCAPRPARRTSSARRSTAAGWTRSSGTVAGDDTVLVVVDEQVGGAAMADALRRGGAGIAAGRSSDRHRTGRTGLTHGERVVLAYSGGLDTSVAVRWLIEHEGVEVIAVAVDVGQAPTGRRGLGRHPHRGPRRGRGRGRRRSTPAHELAEEFCVPALQANALYEGKYPLVSALSRPVIVRHLVAEAAVHGANAVAHGCTGKGNDQVRFEVGARVARPRPRDPRAGAGLGVHTRGLRRLAAKWEIPITVTKEKLYSIDENLWGKAIECGAIEDPWAPAPDDVYTLTRSTEHRARSRSSSASRPACRSPSTASRSVPYESSPSSAAIAGSPRLRPPRHGREPPGRHQEPRGLRVPGRARPDPRPRGPRGPDPRARPAPREGAARAALGRARLRRPVVLAARSALEAFVAATPAPRHR